MYLPLHDVPKRKYFFRIRVTKLACLTLSLPIFALITCVLMTMYKDFENANMTHCNVPNVFPSISAAIGNYEPQNTIWKAAIYFHFPFRFLFIYIAAVHYYQVIREDCTPVVKLALFLTIVENIALLGLSYWTSSKYYPYHEVCFKIFIATSIIYMFLTCIMLTKYRRRPNLSVEEKHSVKMKWRAFGMNAGAFTLAAYCFLRHNRLCEPYVYSLFGFFEYLVVFSNAWFHFTVLYDESFRYIYVTSKRLSFE